MAKYNIYGIGAALLDTEVKVSDKFLADFGIEKGVMTLVDEPRQRELLDSLSFENVKVVKKSGGSVCNSLVAASSLGAKTFFSGKVADDEDGELYVNDLSQAGVDFHSADPAPGTTGKCLVMVTRDAERTMNTFLGASESLSSNEIDLESLKNSDWLYIEGYLFTDNARALAAREAADFARANGVKIAISLSDAFVVNMFGEALRSVMYDGVDLIFCNKEEALAFTRKDCLNFAVEDLKHITRNFVITDGANGAITYDGEVVLKSDGQSTNAIDSNGAGDMFAGAFLYAVISGRGYDWAAKLANNCAARVVSKFGPRLETEEFDEIKKQFDI